MGLALTTITDSIAGLTVTGLLIKDIDEVPNIWDGRAPVIFPEPMDFLTNFEAVPATNGTGTTRAWDVTYTMRYTLLYCNGTDGRGLENMKSAIDLALDFMDAVIGLTTISGCVTIKPGTISTPGMVPDPSGKLFYGCHITVNILEFVN